MKTRILFQVEPEVAEHLRWLSNDRWVTVAHILRRCVDIALPQVEAELPKPETPEGLRLNKDAPKPEGGGE